MAASTGNRQFFACCVVRRFENMGKNPEGYWVNTSQDVRGAMLPLMDGYYRDKEQVQRDEAMHSCGIAAQTLMLAAKALGCDSCPMDGFDFDKVGELIRLTDDHVVTMFVVIGKAIADPYPRGGQLALEEIVVTGRFEAA